MGKVWSTAEDASKIKSRRNYSIFVWYILTTKCVSPNLSILGICLHSGEVIHIESLYPSRKPKLNLADFKFYPDEPYDVQVVEPFSMTSFDLYLF